MATRHEPYSERFKAKALAHALALGVEQAAKKMNINPSTLYNWRDRLKNGNGSTPLPTVKATAKPKARALTPITFACPHCGGPVVLPT